MPLEIILRPVDTFPLCVELIGAEDAREEQREKIRRQLEADFLTAQAQYGKKRVHPEREAALANFHGRAKELAEVWVAEKRAFRMQLFRLSEHANIPKDPDGLYLFDTFGGNYNQSNNHGYSHNAAQTVLEKAEFYGFRGEVVCKPHDAHEVWINVPPGAPARVLAVAPGPPFREVIRRQLKRGINPTAANPYLPNPSDLLRDLGLDWFGNDVVKNV